MFRVALEMPRLDWLVAIVALGVVAISARPYAGGWNDGSRLAAVESIVERGTLAIDDSIFCRPHLSSSANAPLPYAAHDASSLAHGTLDKGFVDGHYYSDKPAVISFLLAAMYQFALWLGLPSAGERPDLFCWWMTFVSSGLALAAAAVSMLRVGRRIRLKTPVLLAWLGSFVFATFALTYTRHVNNHLMQLGIVAAVTLLAMRLADDVDVGLVPWKRVIWLGTLVGVGFNLDFGSGPLLVIAVGGLVAYRVRRIVPLGVFALAVLPWVVAGLAINYAIGGVWKPFNMVPEYMDWPGSPFSHDNLTGVARHSLFKLPIYALALLFGKHGFLVHNLPLLLTIPALFAVIRRSGPPMSATRMPELLTLLGWCTATWILYAVLSNNSGGACCSIRWFVPFLAPLYLLLGMNLQRDPESLAVFLVLTFWGVVLGAIMWWHGPWTLRMTPMLWPIVAIALTHAVIVRVRRQKLSGPIFRGDGFRSVPHVTPIPR